MRRAPCLVISLVCLLASHEAFSQTCTESSRPFRNIRDYIRWCEQDCGGTWTGSQCVFNTYTPPPPPSPQQLSEEDRGLAIRLKNEGNLREAEIAARRAIDRFDSPDAENTLGTILHDMKRYAEAAAAYRRALSLGERKYARGNLFNVLIAWGRKALDDQAYSFALDRFREALDLNPSEGDAWYWVGVGYEKLDRFDQAEDALRRAMAYGDRDAGPHLAYMLSHVARNWYERDWAKAEVLLRKALALKPDDAELRNSLGYVLGKLGRRAEEKEAYEAAARRGSKYARGNLAIVLANEAFEASRRGDTTTAEAKYRAALAQDPDNKYSRFRLGELLAEQDRFSEAREHLERAQELGYPEAARLLARGYSHEGFKSLDSGNYEEARKAFAAANARGDSGAADMLNQLTTRQASDKEKAGDFAAAERLYRKAMQEGEPYAKSGLALMYYRQGVEAAKRGDAASAERAYAQAQRLGLQAAAERLETLRQTQESISSVQPRANDRRAAITDYASLLQREADLLSRYKYANAEARVDIAGQLAVLRAQIRQERASLVRGVEPRSPAARAMPARLPITPFQWPDTQRGLTSELERASRFIQGGPGSAEAELRAMGGATSVPLATGRPVGAASGEAPVRYERLPRSRETPVLRNLAQSHDSIEQTIRKLQSQVEEAPSARAALTASAAIAKEREKLLEVEKQYESFSIRTRGRDRTAAKKADEPQ